MLGAFSKLAGFQVLFSSRDFLEPRPLLQAMEQRGGSVLLVDEVDMSEESFEALLLEVLSDYQVTIPEIQSSTRGQSMIRHTANVEHSAKGVASYAIRHPTHEFDRRPEMTELGSA